MQVVSSGAIDTKKSALPLIIVSVAVFPSFLTATLHVPAKDFTNEQ